MCIYIYVYIYIYMYIYVYIYVYIYMAHNIEATRKLKVDLEFTIDICLILLNNW